MAKTAEATRTDKESETQTAQTQAQEREAAGLHLHTRTLHPPVPIPYVTLGDVKSTARSATSRLPGKPSGKDLVFYGGLGALTVAGALEWPVAVAVGGAAWLLRGKGGETREAGAEAPTMPEGKEEAKEEGKEEGAEAPAKKETARARSSAAAKKTA